MSNRRENPPWPPFKKGGSLGGSLEGGEGLVVLWKWGILDYIEY